MPTMTMCLFPAHYDAMMGKDPVGFGIIDIESREGEESSLERQVGNQNLGSEETHWDPIGPAARVVEFCFESRSTGFILR